MVSSNCSWSAGSLIGVTCGLALGVSAAAATSFEASCSSIARSIVASNPAVSVNIAQYVAAGTNITLPDNDPSCNLRSMVTTADICRLAMSVTTSSTSGIILESWLPRNWTGRFLSGGNGGLNGCIDYATLAYGSGLGFSTAAANNGHNGTSGLPFLNHPETIADFAYRSVHTGAVVGKQVTRAMYGCHEKKSYYLGCSTGGREGYKEAQDFPEDFDGIVAGAPAFDFNHLIAWSYSFFQYLGTNTSSTFVPAALWKTINAEILKQCDGLDGAMDGIIEDAELCYWRPESLICAKNQTTNCLTGTQAAAVRKVYEPLYGINGTLLYPRMQPGSELAAVNFLYAGAPFTYSVDWYKYAALSVNFTNANYTPATLAYIDSIDSTKLYNISTWKGDLSRFRNRGGKILTYHGQQDFLISSANSPRYYNHVATTMNLSSSEIDTFYRFFRVGGMGHCTGGPGAWQFGQTGPAYSYGDIDDNILLRMVAWVENGNAPEYIRGTKFVNDTRALGVQYQRKHCKYPARNMYVGPANYSNPDAWTCVGDSF